MYNMHTIKIIVVNTVKRKIQQVSYKIDITVDYNKNIITTQYISV